MLELVNPPQYRHVLSGLYAEADVAERLHLGAGVGEGHILEFNSAFERRRLVCSVREFGLFFQELIQPLHRCVGALN